MFAFILILHSFQLIFMDSAVYRDFFLLYLYSAYFFFIHSRRLYVISAFPIFCISASVLFLCIQLL